MIRTYSLTEVAAQYLPNEWAGGERWLRERLNRGEISGYKVGRTWRMTEDDVADFLARCHNTTTETPARQAPAASVIDGLSERTRRRLRAAS